MQSSVIATETKENRDYLFGENGHGSSFGVSWEVMSIVTDRILDEALQLPVAERARVAAELIASIDGPPDPGAEEAWAAEVEQRARRSLVGESTSEDWGVVRQRISDKLRNR